MYPPPHIQGMYPPPHIQGVAKDYSRSGQLAFDLCTSVPVSWIEYVSREMNCRYAQCKKIISYGNNTFVDMFMSVSLFVD